MRLQRILILVVLIGLLISGCNIPSNSQAGVKINAVFTSAAETVEAKLTQAPAAPGQASPSAASNPPTDAAPAPLPTITEAPVETESAPTLEPSVTIPATPTQVCDAAQFVADVTIPDGTIVKTNDFFTKTWRFKNVGTCTWNTSYNLVFDVGDQMGGPTSVALTGNVAPGAEVELSVELQAPAKTGSYRSFWRLRNPAGVMLPISGGYKNKSFYVDIHVKDNVNSNVVSNDRALDVSHVDFIVTHTGTCASGTYIITAKITATAPGEVSYKWKRSDGISDSLSTGKITFQASGVQNITYNWPTAATGLSVSLSIITPTEKDFGPALLNCVS